jgi:hypothetical protein
MPWPDFADIKTQVRNLLDEATAAQWTDADINSWINDGHRDIAAKTNCIESIQPATTTSGSRLVPFTGHKVNHVEYLPGGTVKPIGLQRITPAMLGHIQLHDLSTPQYYFQWGSNVVIEPIPATACNLNLYLSVWPDCELSDTTDEPQIPVEFHESIIPFTLFFARIKSSEYTKSALAYSQYMTALQQLIDGYLVRTPTRYIDLKIPTLAQEKKPSKSDELANLLSPLLKDGGA